jgi:hypothetical protein
MGWCRENRLVEQIFPIAGEFLPGDDICLDEFSDAIGQHDGIAGLGRRRVAEIHRRRIQGSKRLHQAEAAFLIIGKCMGGNHAPLMGRQPDLFGLGDEITDG